MPTKPNRRPLSTNRLVALASACLLLSAVLAPGTASGVIPALERQALIDLYNGTNGAGWTNSTNWKLPPLDVDGFAMPGTEGTWYGLFSNGSNVLTVGLNANNLVGTIPSTIGDLTSLQYLRLSGNFLTGSLPSTITNLTALIELEALTNQLSGAIPSGIGGKPSLQKLLLSGNQLSGAIPTQIGTLPALTDLALAGNQLSGSIPTEIGFLTNLQNAYLRYNFLTGTIPTEIGSLTNLLRLSLDGNQLVGPVPASMTSLTNLIATQLDLRFNALYSNNAGLIAFLNNLQVGNDWQGTQTIAPSGVATSGATLSSIDVTWIPIAFNGSSGYYEVLSSLSPGGPYSSVSTTLDKLATGLTIPGNPGTTYYFVVRTVTAPLGPPFNPGWVTSDYSSEVSGATLSCSYSLSTPSFGFWAGAVVGTTFQVLTSPGCPWTAEAGVFWVTITGGSSGAGTGTVTFDVALNLGAPRIGSILAGGQTLNLTQDDCATSTNLIPTSSSPAGAGASGLTFGVFPPAGCPWAATSNDAWITITAGFSGVGTGSVTYDVAANGGGARVGTLTVNGKTFTVNQDAGCAGATSLSPASASPPAAGVSGQTFQVNILASCPWAATSNDAWITVTGGASGVGTGIVTYDVAANLGPLRVGTITAGGLTFTVTQANGCTYLLNPSSATPPAAGAVGQTFQVQTSAGCAWTEISNDAWITIDGPPPAPARTATAAARAALSGVGTGTVSYSVAANSGPLRVGTITAGGQTFTVTQANGCVYQLNPASAPAPAGGAVGQTFQVQTAVGCAWTAVSNDLWITVTGGASGSGNGIVTYTVASNSGAPRVGTITAGGQAFTVTQASGCTYVLSPAGASVAAPGASGQTFQVQTSAGTCTWTAVSNDAWLTVTGGVSGTGTGIVTYSVAANSGSQLVGTITAGGQTFTVTQANGCAYTLAPASAPAPAAGATGQTLQVQTSAGCTWAASSNAVWITVTGGASGSGPGPVTYTVASNSGAARVGTITAAGQAFTVTQAGGCTYVLSPVSAAPPAAGVAGQTFQVQTAVGCAWTAISNDPWITVTGGASGSGPGPVTYSVASNSGSQRAGTITAGGQAFTVTQAGGCAHTLAPVSAAPPAAGVAGQTFQVQTAVGCAWTAISNDAWITVTGGAIGSGPGTVTYTVGANIGPQRVGTITAGGQTFTVTQASGCTYQLNPANATAGAAGATGQFFQLQTSATCPWTATSNAAWITITAGATGTGNGIVTYNVGANAGPTRIGTITAGGQAFTVSQADSCAANTTLNPSNASVSASGAAGLTFQLQTSAACPWTATSNAAWITITAGATGTGNGIITYDVGANAGPTRVGTITAGSQTFTVSQADSCAASTTLNPANASVPATGAAGQTFQLLTPAACPWTATSDAAWITISSGVSGTGNGVVAYAAAVNAGPERIGTITAGGQAFVVSQAEGCAAGTTLSPSNASVSAAGATGQTFQLLTSPVCPWTATSNAPWITLSSVASGTGTATVTFSVAANSGPARIGIITAGGLTFPISQADGCDASTTLDPLSASVQAAGANGEAFRVQAAAGCSWTVVSNASWITISSGASGTGTATVTYNVAANSGSARIGTITASGKTFTVSQACKVPSTPQLTSYPKAPVVAGNSFTVAWGAVADLPATGSYQVQVSPDADCTSPVSSITTELSLTVTTDPARAMTHCVKVRALAGSCAPDYGSEYSPSITVRSQPLPAAFTVLQGQNPSARANRNGAPPVGSTVVFRNVGEVAGTLAFSATGGFFSISPQAPQVIAKGADATISIVFASDSTLTAGVRTGELIGAWSSGDGSQSVSTAITLTVLEAPSQPTKGMKLEPVGSGLVHFRQLQGNPEPQQITVRNTGSLPVRIAPSIGPGGSWLSISGDFASPIRPGGERSFLLAVDRFRRTTEDGPPPLSTALEIENVDGNPEDSAIFNVLDEEPQPSTPGTNRPELTESEFSLILGSSASTTSPSSREGKAANDGPQYISDGWIRNRGSDPVAVDVFYTPEGAQGLTDPRVKKNTVTLTGYRAYRLTDFVKSLFSETGSGHVELRSSQLPQLSVRTSVDVITSRDGVPTQYGAEVPLFVSGQGVVVSKGSGAAEVILLAGLQGPLKGRLSNIVFSETLGKSIDVRASLYDTSGKRLGERTVFLNPYSKVQVNAGDPELFPVPYSEGTVEIEPVAGDGAVSAFATVTDGGSRSYTVRHGTVLSRPPAASRPALAVVESTAFLPTMTREETSDAFYTTRLSVTNASDAEVTLQVTFIPDRGLGDVTDPKTLVIPKRGGADGQGGPQAVTYGDVLKEFLGIESGTRGMLKVVGGLTGVAFSSETTTPIDLKDPSLGSSLSSVNPAAGVEQKIAGAFAADSKEVAGMKQSDSDTVNAEVSLPAIEEGPQFRTNLILAELAGQASKVRVLLRKAGGASLGEPLVVDLAPNERKQILKIISEITKPPGGVADFKDVEIIVQAMDGKGRTLALVNRISNDPTSKRLDTYVLGPNVTGAKKKGTK